MKDKEESFCILIADDDPIIRKILSKYLLSNHYNIREAKDFNEIKNNLEKFKIQLILFDYHFPDGFAKDFIPKLEAMNLLVPFIIMTAEDSQTIAIDMMKMGARDYIMKDKSFVKFLPTIIEKTLRQIHLENELKQKEKQYKADLEKKVEERTIHLKRTLHRIKHSQAHIKSIFRTISDGLLVVNDTKEIIMINTPAKKILEITNNSFSNRNTEKFINDQKLLHFIHQSIVKKNKSDFIFEKYDKNNKIRIYKIRSNPTFLVNINFVLFVIYDITKEKELENMKSEFVSIAAHELQTPLTSILGYAELLLNRKSIDEKKRNRFLNFIFEQGKALSKIVTSLLDISRIESGKGFTIVREKINIIEILKKRKAIFESESNHNIQIINKLNNSIIYTDEEKINQVFNNLISNAIKYSSENKNIIITIDKSKKKTNGIHHICFTIQDFGIGMTQDQIESIFDKFYRADEVKNSIQGIGLGMGIVKHIVEALGGNISIKSKINKGTTIQFDISQI